MFSAGLSWERFTVISEVTSRSLPFSWVAQLCVIKLIEHIINEETLFSYSYLKLSFWLLQVTFLNVVLANAFMTSLELWELPGQFPSVRNQNTFASFYKTLSRVHCNKGNLSVVILKLMELNIVLHTESTKWIILDFTMRKWRISLILVNLWQACL